MTVWTQLGTGGRGSGLPVVCKLGEARWLAVDLATTTDRGRGAMQSKDKGGHHDVTNQRDRQY
jgi:hypothetical protein